MAATIETTFRVGPYKVHMAIKGLRRGQAAQLETKWEPRLPPSGLSPVFLSQYRAGRDAFVTEAAKQLGGAGLVIEA